MRASSTGAPHATTRCESHGFADRPSLWHTGCSVTRATHRNVPICRSPARSASVLDACRTRRMNVRRRLGSWARLLAGLLALASGSRGRGARRAAAEARRRRPDAAAARRRRERDGRRDAAPAGAGRPGGPAPAATAPTRTSASSRPARASLALVADGRRGPATWSTPPSRTTTPSSRQSARARNHESTHASPVARPAPGAGRGLPPAPRASPAPSPAPSRTSRAAPCPA